jgi:hypothetical protein
MIDMTESSTIRQASCQCNQVDIKAIGDPLRSAICHCLSCQKRTGSVFGVQARFQTSQITVIGELVSFTRIADSGDQVTHQFCPQCGTTMMMSLSNAPDSIVIPLGVFNCADFPAPAFSVYEYRKRGWVAFECEMDHFD